MTANSNKKETARKLAQAVLNREIEIQQALETLNSFHSKKPSLSQSKDRKNKADVSLRVGIWEPVQHKEELYFIRSPKADDWPGAWCDQEVIPPKHRRQRILLLGESVARGMHYDPFFTPASVLEGYLQQYLGTNEYEVIDIARIDATMGYLQQTLPLSLQMDPDLILIFAGNNWKNDPSVLSSIEIERNTATLSTIEGLRQYHKQRDQALNSLVDRYVDLVESCQSLGNVPIIHVLPDFNLHDWQPKNLGVCPLICPEKNHQWYELYEQLYQSFESNQHDAIVRYATQLMELDEGYSATGPYFLGQSLLRKKEYQLARSYLEMAADFEPIPRCTQSVQHALRRASETGRLNIIDLPKLFDEQAPALLPDRFLFLDYCHLTVKGIRHAMGLIAEHLLSYFGRSHLVSEMIRPLPISLHIEACGHFCGALYNGRFGQPYVMLFHHIQRSLDLDPSMQQLMLSFLEHNVSPASKGLNNSYLNSRDTPLHIIQKRLSIPKAHWNVIKAIWNALSAYNDIQQSMTTSIANLLDRQFNVERRAMVKLLDSNFWNHYNQIHKTSTLYLSCNQPSTVIEFVAGAKESIEIDITLRVAVGTGDIVISINGFIVVTILGTVNWKRVSCKIPREYLESGTDCESDGRFLIQTLSIKWPVSSLGWVKSYSRLPTFGEIYTLNLNTTGEPSSTTSHHHQLYNRTGPLVSEQNSY